jgi:acetyltransferase-like isoleucine patch superfamily enzyme
VTIGKGSLIGANSLVSRSIPAGVVVAAGSAAKVIRNLKSGDEIARVADAVG